jgi:hypothetical protein
MQTEPHNEETPFQYDEQAAINLVDKDQVVRYFQTIFGNVQWNDDTHICLRGIGEKGTPKEGVFRSDNFFQPNLADPTDGIMNCVDIWARNAIACFVVPAVLREQKGTAENVSMFTNILADLDSGNTEEKLAFMDEHLGAPSMVVRSGGMTEEGTPKYHVYYVLENPTEDIRKAIIVRDMLARKCGGDLTMGLGVDGNPFGRAHQPVRVPGSVHAKNGKPSACSIESRSTHRYSLDRLEKDLSAIEDSPYAVEVSARSAAPLEERIAQGSLFSVNSGGNGSASDVLHEKVYEGGSEKTRWGQFNRVAGLHISMARRGEVTVQKAFDDTYGWVLANMIPPWPPQRVEHEFAALLAHDIRHNGPMPEPEPPMIREEQRMAEGGLGLKMWAAHRWVTEPKPEHHYLVDGLIIKGEPHLFVAEGGAGKTFQVADLAMKIAAHEPEDDAVWFGQKIIAGGTTVLILCEDSQTEMHRRLLEINLNERIKKAGDKFIVLPMTKLGGAFPLVELDRHGESRPSKRWAEMLSLLREIPDLVLVCIDTLNSVSHSDENSALGISQMMREAQRVCGDLGAALIVNHHVRKQGQQATAIGSLDDLRNAIRGSSAITSYFRINIGMFSVVDYDRRMKAMGMMPEKGALWRFGVCKANIHGMMRGEKTLLRNNRGLMDDVTSRDVFQGGNHDDRMAWLIFACAKAAENGHPYTNGTKGSSSGLYKRRAELPPALRFMGGRELDALLGQTLQAGHLVTAAVRGSKGKQFIDSPNGPLATDEAGAVLSAGAYTTVPDWSQFAFCEVQGTIVNHKQVKKPFAKS